MESAELINFLSPKLSPTAKCSCTTDDFYTVDNLISADRQKSQLGFMASRVVKPPIELHFSLLCRIELSSIKLWPQINSLKSTGFEILVNNNDASREYQKVASHFNLAKNCLQFTTDTSVDCDGNVASVRFYSSSRQLLRKVKNIKVCIKQTNRCCVPVLKRIEVWGKVSIFEDNEQHEKIQRLISTTPVETIAVDNSSSTNSNKLADDLDSTEQLAIPEAYLDALTYAIMALPMILPCGKVVDNSSLVRHNEEEVRWGRLPSDPFTGQIFTDSRKPILDVRVKTQIDAFLLKNCDNSTLNGVARTVGSTKRRKLNATDVQPTNDTASTSTSINFVASPSNDEAGLVITSQATANNLLVTSSSVTSIVHDILRVRKYTKINQNTRETSLSNCYQCQSKHETESNSLYLIRLCSHLICRHCLVDSHLKLCKCGQEFSNFHVKKYHITREI